MTLALCLQQLSREDPECLFIVRRISKLGYRAANKLKRHFGRFGAVVNVLLAHSTIRTESEGQWRCRPSGLGFVQFESPAAVQQVLALGGDQEVEGVMIRVQKFEKPREGSENEVAEEDLEVSTKVSESLLLPWERQRTCLSAFSTTDGSSPSSDGDVEHGEQQEAVARHRFTKLAGPTVKLMTLSF